MRPQGVGGKGRVFPGAVPEVWVHEHPRRPAIAFVRGKSLWTADDAADREYLEDLVRNKVEALPPMPPQLEAMWDRQAAQIAAMQDRA